MARPPTTSLDSLNGPSVTLISPLERRTRAPMAVGMQPSRGSKEPALMPSSTSLFMSHISCSEGGRTFSTDLYMLRNFMTISLVSLGSALNCRELRNAHELPLYRATNEALRNRHEERIIFLGPGQGMVEYMLEKNMKENAHDCAVRQWWLPSQQFAARWERLCQTCDPTVQQFVPKVPAQCRHH